MIKACLFFLAMTSAAMAQSSLQQATQRAQTLGVEGVGRLDTPHSYCSGVLIDNDLVLTAAHCLFHDGDKMDPTEMIFKAGILAEEAITERKVRRAVLMRDYRVGDDDPINNLRNDLALLQLESGIPLGVAKPFEVNTRVARKDKVTVVSFARDRNHTLSRENDCDVVDHWEDVLSFSCDVDHGSSGAPVFRIIGSRLQIVSVISRGMRDQGKAISFGIQVAPAVAQMRSDMINGFGVYPKEVVSGRKITVGGARSVGGARFVKP